MNADILKEILYGGPDDFNSLHICPELDYFKEELKSWGSSISGIEISEDGIQFEITSYGLEAETMSTLFKDHFDEYFK